MSKRTAKDESEYVANQLRESPIKSEVIVEFRNQNRALWQAQVTLLEELIDAQDHLRAYRVKSLEMAKQAVDVGTRSCVPGCTKHEWHDDNGWYRAGERKKVAR